MNRTVLADTLDSNRSKLAETDVKGGQNFILVDGIHLVNCWSLQRIITLVLDSGCDLEFLFSVHNCTR